MQSCLPQEGALQHVAREELEGTIALSIRERHRTRGVLDHGRPVVLASLEPPIRRFDQGLGATIARSPGKIDRFPVDGFGFGRLSAQAIERVDQLRVHLEEKPRSVI